GTVFKVKTDGSGYTVLKHFSPAPYDYSTGTSTNSDGAGPLAGLTLSDGVLYGTTTYGGSSGYGTVFKINTDGTGFTVLRNFAGYLSNDASGGRGRLALSGTTLYGTTDNGGRWGLGTVFKVNTDGTG